MLEPEIERRTIIHLDMDAFYASVEQRDNPALKGKPVVVGGSLRRGVVSAASYEARRYGIHSAMPMARALRLCPGAAVLPVRMDRYAEVSRAVFAIFREYTPLVEPLSLDEAFCDVTRSRALFGTGVEIARQIRVRVRAETGLTVSAGVAPNKFLAKIASDQGKPDGLTMVEADTVLDFLAPLPVARIWGVGKVAEKTLRDLGVRSIADLRRISADTLRRRFGAAGQRLFELARGIDERPVELPEGPKSVGREDTYEQDLRGEGTIRARLLDLSEQVARRLRRKGFAGCTISLKMRYSDFSTVTRARTLMAPTDDGGVIYAEACGLLRDTEAGVRPVRLLGVSVAGLRETGRERQPILFRGEEERRRRLNATLDGLAERFGDDVVLRSRLLKEREEQRNGETGPQVVNEECP